MSVSEKNTAQAFFHTFLVCIFLLTMTGWVEVSADETPVGTWTGTLNSSNCSQGVIDSIFYDDGTTEAESYMYCANTAWVITDDAVGTYTYTNGVLTATYTGNARESFGGTNSDYTMNITNGVITDCDVSEGEYDITFDNPLWGFYGYGSDSGTWDMSRTSMPCKATNPTPNDTAQDQLANTFLSWSNCGGCVFDVYLDTINPPVELIYEDLEELACEPGILFYNTSYYWRVDVKNTNGTMIGNVWQFKTRIPDVSGNGMIGFEDLEILAWNWLDDSCEEPTWCEQSDLDYSGTIQLSDFAIIARHWLTGDPLIQDDMVYMPDGEFEK